MTDTAQPQPGTENKDAPDKQGMGARALVAAAFATIGAKIGFIGTILDVNHLFKDQKMSFGKKMHAVFSPEIIEHTMKEVRTVMQKENKSMFTAILKVNKWGMITTLGGVAIGAVLGWTRGGKIKSWKDIFAKPVESTEIILGIKDAPKEEEKDAAKDGKNLAAQTATDNKEASADTHWQQHVATTRSPKQNHAHHASHVDAVTNEIPTGQGLAV